MFTTIPYRPLRHSLTALALAALAFNGAAAPVTIDFEGVAFVDGSSVGNAVPGLTFTNEIVSTVGISLNEFDFPPHSGSNVLSDDGGSIQVAFSTGVFSAGAYVTYTAPLRLEAFDSNGGSLGQVNSLASDNYGSNEFISITDTLGRIASVTFTTDLNIVSFTLDDLTFDRGNGTGVPEPQSLALVAAALAGLVGTRRRRS